jgi:hypothetical protein
MVTYMHGVIGKMYDILLTLELDNPKKQLHLVYTSKNQSSFALDVTF